VKALTICQPYAELIAIGAKKVENRVWPTSYRGPLMIHAGKSRTWLTPESIADNPKMDFGAIVAVATVINCKHIDRLDSLELADPYVNGPFCWFLADVKRLARPIPCSGAQGLWLPTPDVIAQVLAQIGKVA
jgi:hypothetical protein